MKFHDELNPKLWNKDENKGETSYSLKPEVADKLMEIASFFIESNNINENAIEDIRLLGSSANFNYNRYSDIDLHLVVDFDKLHKDCPIVNDYAWAIKQIFNQEHEISIYDIPVEIYLEPVDQPANSNGIYSLIDQDWIKKPEKIEPTDNDIAVQAKFEEISQAIDKIEDSEYADELLNKIYAMRKSGLADGGEFSTENMAFKLLRNGGYLDKLREMKKANIDKELTLENYIEEMSLVELALHRDESTDIADYIDRASKDNKKYNNTKFTIPGYKLSIPFFVIINHIKKHDLDVNDYNNLFKNLNNIIAAKKTRPNSLGRETYNIGVKADNAYFYLNIAINNFDNLVCTIDKSTYKGVITHVYELQKKSLSMMPTSQPSASISNKTDSVATHSQDSNNMIQYLITKINGTSENYEDILNIGEKQTMRKTIVEERVEPSEIYDLAVANLPAEDIDHHASDLYIRKTPESEALIKQMGDQAMLSTFVDNIDGDTWYDLPFCYKPYWTKSESQDEVKTMKKKINEISDELKQRVLDKRKEQVSQAQAKLNKATKLAKPKKDIRITLNNPTIEVYEDSYEEGMGNYVNAWEGQTFTATISNYDEFLSALQQSAYQYDQELGGVSFNVNGQDEVMTTFFLNVDNEYPSNSEIEGWKNGKITLYSGDYYSRVTFENPEDREVFINILKEGGSDINESLIVTTTFDQYRPWSGATGTYEKIERAGMLDELESFLEELYPEGISLTGINDLLWFDDEYVLEALGLLENEEDEDMEESLKSTRKINENDEVESIWNYLVDSYTATQEELELITSINGYTVETLNDVIYARTGMRNIEQLKSEYGEDEESVVNEISNELKDRVTNARKKELKNADRAFVAARKKAWKDTEGMEPKARKEAIMNNDKLNRAEGRADKATRKLANNRMLRKTQSESLADSILKEAHEVLSMNESAEAGDMTTWSFKANGFSKAMLEKQNIFGTSEVRCIIHESSNGTMIGTATVNYYMPKEQVEEAIKNALRENGFRTTVISELVNLY